MEIRHEKHLDDAELRAWLDGELPLRGAARCRRHLRRCESCRRALEELRSVDERSTALLGVLPRAADRAPSARGRHRGIYAVAAAAVALAMLVAALYGAHTRRRAPLVTSEKDVCCFDLDGGGPGDDGIFTLSRAGELVECVVLYDDRDRNRALSPGDRIRFISRPSACGPAVASAGAPTPALVLAAIAEPSR